MIPRISQAIARPRFYAGLLLFCALGDGIAFSQPRLESSAQIFPERDGGPRQILWLITKGEKIHDPCPEKPGFEDSEGPSIKRKSMALTIDTSHLDMKTHALTKETAMRAIRLAADEWSSQSKNIPRLAIRKSPMPIQTAFRRDGQNTVSWQNLSPFSTQTLAAITLFIDEQTNEIVEFDIALDRSESWTISGVVQETWGTLEGAYDISNAMTSVFGYVLGLGGIREEGDCASTMFFSILPEETIKRSLSVGDVFGIKKLYDHR